MAVTIRVGRPEDGPTLQAVELLAGAQFRTIDDPAIAAAADHEPMSLEELAAYARSGRSWVAVTEAGIVGYALVDVVDDCAHLEQISVRPAHQGVGVGQALMAQVEEWADDTLGKAVTLTTFRDVPWNQPLYEHLGYRPLTDDEIGPGLRARMAEEAGHGLDPEHRAAMRKDLVPPAPPRRLEPFAVLTLLAGIAALVTVVIGFWGFVALVLALALHAAADRRIKARPLARRGHKLANVGLGIALAGVVLGLGAFYFRGHARTGEYAVSSLEVGECFDDEPAAANPTKPKVRSQLLLVSCSKPHLGEVILNERIDADRFPGRDQLHADGLQLCAAAYLSYVGRTVDDSEFDVNDWEPTDDAWSSGLRRRVCAIQPETEGNELPPGSLEHTAR